MQPDSTQGWTCELKSLNDTARLAKLLIKKLPIPVTIGLKGTLGAGKTQLVRFFVEALGGNSNWVTSPTYVMVQSYATTPEVHHLDAYRLKDIQEFHDLGVDELMQQPAYTLIEWSDKVENALPEDYLEIELVPNANGLRHAHLKSVGSEYVSCITQIAAKWNS
jgi:tRNA threonylcarbamoyladenosine biosynthesis protein TsaE